METTNSALPFTPARLRACLFVLILLTVATYFHRNPSGDDGWFAEQSYWLLKSGIIRSNYFTGVLNWDVQLLVSPKLFLAVGAAFMYLFGNNLVAFQSTGLLFFIILIGLLINYVYEREKTLQSKYLLALLILVFANRLLIKMSFENRPELMLAAIGFGSFQLLNSRNLTRMKAVAAGALAGLAVLTHLNGAIYVMAGFATYLYLKEYKNALLFGIAGGLVSLCYFIDVVTVKDGFSIWYYQFRNDPATQNAFGIGSKLRVMLTYPVMFFQPLEVLALTLVFVYMAYSQRQFAKSLPRKLTVYSVALLIAFWFITKKNSGFYSLLFMPFMLALIYELYRQKPFWNKRFNGVLLLYFVIGLYGTIELIYKNIKGPYLPDKYAELSNYIPPHSNGLVPLTFFFNEYDRYAKLLTYNSFQFQHKPDQYTPAHLAAWARKENLTFMVVDYKTDRTPYMPTESLTQVGPFRRTFSDGRFAVYTLAASTPAPKKSLMKY